MTANAKLLFQVDLAPGETRTFYILDASALAAVPPPIVKTFARYVPERHDDFAWESDRIAHRIFGKALETWQEEPLTSSGVDVWIKRTRNLIVNEMYRTRTLLRHERRAQDDYRVGKTRGCGGLGIWDGKKLYVSSNWRNCKVITTGPIRSEFELTYDAWDAGNGRMVSETKRISIDAGSNLSRVESTFSSDDKSPLTIGVGLAERPGENIIADVRDGDYGNSSRQLAKQHRQRFGRAKSKRGLDDLLAAAGFCQRHDRHRFHFAERQRGNFHKRLSGSAAEQNRRADAHVDRRPAGHPQPARPSRRRKSASRSFIISARAGARAAIFRTRSRGTNYVRRFAERRDQPLQARIGN